MDWCGTIRRLEHHRLDDLALMQKLRIVIGGLRDDLWISDDPLRNAGSTCIGVTLWGLGETLTRVSPSGEVVPWLADEIHNLDPLTWQVRLRRDARFWDGTPVAAEEVASSFERSCQVQKDVSLMLDLDTRARVVDARTVEFTMSRPAGNFAAALAHPQLIIHRANGSVLTGPYRPVEFEPDRCLVLDSFADHWAGLPSIPRITVRVIPEFEARVEALESGEADVIYAFPPEHIGQLRRFRGSYEVVSFPSMRAHSIQLNCSKPPFDERAVRQATSLAIDRDALIRDVLDGRGVPMLRLIPPWSGEYAASPPGPDAARAAQLLDAAGWIKGDDGVRHKGEERLALTLYTPTGPVLAMRALAARIAEQLAPLGYAVTPCEVPALSVAVKEGAYNAALRTSYSQLTGDPYFWLKLWLSRGGRANPGPSYVNPELDQMLEDYRAETDATQRRVFRRQLDTLLATDVPHVLLVFMPLILVARRGLLRALVNDPNNEYFIGSSLRVTRGL
jgi:peptide/nickel transport system substrate-binding protein